MCTSNCCGESCVAHVARTKPDTAPSNDSLINDILLLENGHPAPWGEQSEPPSISKEITATFKPPARHLNLRVILKVRTKAYYYLPSMSEGAKMRTFLRPKQTCMVNFRNFSGLAALSCQPAFPVCKIVSSWFVDFELVSIAVNKTKQRNNRDSDCKSFILPEFQRFYSVASGILTTSR